MTALRIFSTNRPRLRFEPLTGYDTEFARFLELRRERKEVSDARQEA